MALPRNPRNSHSNPNSNPNAGPQPNPRSQQWRTPSPTPPSQAQQQYPNASLERWIAQQQAQAGNQTGPWDLYFSRNFADLWYGARAAGEHLRGIVLQQLYRSRPIPGGPHPDPRKPAAFSSRAILEVAAERLGLRISPITHPSDNPSDTQFALAWIVTHTGQTGQTVRQSGRMGQGGPVRQHPPELVLRTLHANRLELEFEIACLLGYWQHEHHLLNDPDAPPTTAILPPSSGIQALLHQYAIALLCLPEECPPELDCHCNEIRQRFNAPPPDHERPTSSYTIEEIQAEAQQAIQIKRDTDPHFPYHTSDPWPGQ